VKKELIGLDAAHPVVGLDAWDVRLAVLRTLPDGVARDLCCLWLAVLV
jgi:hypothetical protein